MIQYRCLFGEFPYCLLAIAILFYAFIVLSFGLRYLSDVLSVEALCALVITNWVCFGGMFVFGTEISLFRWMKFGFCVGGSVGVAFGLLLYLENTAMAFTPLMKSYALVDLAVPFWCFGTIGWLIGTAVALVISAIKAK